MGQKIYLYWYKHPQGHGNFGDELNPYIITAMTDTPVEYINVRLLYDNKLLAFEKTVKAFLKKRIGYRSFSRYLKYNFISRPTILLSIGSILQFCRYRHTLVWGSGIKSFDSNVHIGQYLAVRGYITLDKIKNSGHRPPAVVGDPALLLPLIYIPPTQKNHLIGILPHYHHYNSIKNNIEDQSIPVIDVTDPIERIIDQIHQCELLITTSLHGLIVAHAYRIPAIRATLKDIPLGGGDFKFEDYFSSVQIPYYQPVSLDQILDLDKTDIKKYFDYHFSTSMRPSKTRVRKIQTDLVGVFPYPLKKDFIP